MDRTSSLVTACSFLTNITTYEDRELCSCQDLQVLRVGGQDLIPTALREELRVSCTNADVLSMHSAARYDFLTC